VNGVQLLLCIGVAVLLGVTCLGMNRHAVTTSQAVVDSRLRLQAVALGQSVIEQAKMLSFDENVGVYPPSYYPYYFTPWWALGPEAGESVFDDVDDWHGYSAQEELGGEIFTVTVEIRYLNEFMAPTYLPTYYKWMHVEVAGGSLAAPIGLDYVFAYMKLSNGGG
jgi:hypothetical protein